MDLFFCGDIMPGGVLPHWGMEYLLTRCRNVFQWLNKSDSVEEVRAVEDGYPFPIEKPIRQVWNPIARYGRTIGFSIQNGENKMSEQYVHLSNQNILSLTSLPRSIKLQMRKFGLIESNRIVKKMVYARRELLAKTTN